jgi:hypothetical protein
MEQETSNYDWFLTMFKFKPWLKQTRYRYSLYRVCFLTLLKYNFFI